MKAKHQDLSKVDLNFDNFELWMTVLSAVELADQI